MSIWHEVAPHGYEVDREVHGADGGSKSLWEVKAGVTIDFRCFFCIFAWEGGAERLLNTHVNLILFSLRRLPTHDCLPNPPEPAAHHGEMTRCHDRIRLVASAISHADAE